MAATAQQIGGALGLAVLVMVANAHAGAAGSPSALAGLVRAEYGAALFHCSAVIALACGAGRIGRHRLPGQRGMIEGAAVGGCRA